MFVLTVFLSFGQKQHLKPAEDFSQYEGVLKKYYDNVFPLLYKGYSKKPIARYTSMPAFSNEYSFSIETTGRKNYVVSNRLSANYWYAKNRKKVNLISSKTELSDDLYLKIVNLFKVLEEQIINPKIDIKIETSTAVTQQKGVITGTVVDILGEPVIGANITEKGTANGVYTDINGKFSLNVSDKAVLNVSYIGYTTQEFAAENNGNITITMHEDMQGLDGVTYYFTTTDKNGQVKIGETWSPSDDSFLGRVVKICDTIYSLENGSISQTEIVKDIDKLLNILKQ